MNMGKLNKWLRHRKFILIILFCLAFFIIGCGPSYEERQAKKEAETQELISEKEAKIKILSDQISEKHNAISFPPENIGATSFTYEIQRFLSSNPDKPVLFKGFLEDIETMGNSVVVEFLCPLGKEFFINKTAIRFRLIIAEEKLKQLLSKKREDPIVSSFRYFDGPDYFVVAKIDGLKRSRRYEFNGSVSGDEVELDVEIPPSFISTGKFVEAVSIPTD